MDFGTSDINITSALKKIVKSTFNMYQKVRLQQEVGAKIILGKCKRVHVR